MIQFFPRDQYHHLLMLTEAHRVLLTYIRARKVVDEDEMQNRMAIIVSKFNLDGTPETLLREYISSINVGLEKFAFKIETVRDQEARRLQYVFINTRFDDVIQACTPYTPPELDAVKQLIDEVVNASNYGFCMPYGNAKQLVGSVLKQRAGDAGYFLTRLVDDGWIEVTSQNRIVLSPASLAELKVYLSDRFGYLLADDSLGKLLTCHVCGDVVTFGVKCQTRSCPSAFHGKCSEVYLRGNEGCPGGCDTLELVRVGAAP